MNVLTKEQDLLFEVINSIPNPNEKRTYLNKLKQTLEQTSRKNLLVTNRYDLKPIFKRLEKSTSKPVTIQVLQMEIHNIKKEIKEIKEQQTIYNAILSNLEVNFDQEEIPETKLENKEEIRDFLGLISHLTIQKFFINIKIIVEDFVLETIALFDTGADSNCILEGLIPTRYFEKTSERLSTANSSKLQIKYKLSSAIIGNQDYRIETPFLLVKDLKNEVILGTPFIKALFPLEISEEGISTKHNGKSIIFRFIRKPITKQINLIQQKSNQINFLKEEISFKNIDSQLNFPQIQQKIKRVLHSIESTICSDLPNNFCSRKKHIVDLPYEQDFIDTQIPTKARPIQMNEESPTYSSLNEPYDII